MGALKKTALVAELAKNGLKTLNMRAGSKDTYDFPRGEVGTSPSGGVSGATVVALPSDAVCQFCRCVVSITDQIIGRGWVVLGLVRTSELLHGAGGDLVRSRRIRI